MLLYSNSGSELNTVKPWVRRRTSRKKKLLPRARTLKESGLLELLLPRSNLPLNLNSAPVDYTLVSLPDQVNPVDVMVTSWKVKN